MSDATDINNRLSELEKLFSKPGALDINKMISGMFPSPNFYKGDDSFAGKYCELLESTVIKGQITIPGYLQSSPYKMAGEYVSYINSKFDERRKLICQGLHEYLLEHDGVAGHLTGSAEDRSYSFADDPSHTKYIFDYFGTDYQVLPDKEKELVVSKEPSLYSMKYRNHYKYPKSKPGDTAELKRVKRKYDSLLVDECKAAEDNIKKAKTVLEGEYGHSRREGFFGTIYSLIWIVFLALACINPVHPINYASVEGWAPAVANWINGLDVHGLTKAVLVFLGNIPILLTSIVAGIIVAPFRLIEWLSSFGMVWYAVGIAALAALCLIGLSVINSVHPAWDLVRPRQIGRCKSKLDEAKEALKQVKAEQARKREEYTQSREYKDAVAKNQAVQKAYEEDKAMNEAFAERWQRTWYDIILDDLESLFGGNDADDFAKEIEEKLKELRG